MSRLSHRLDVSNHYFVGQTEFDGEDFVKPRTLPSVTRIAWAIDSALKRWVQRKHDGTSPALPPIMAVAESSDAQGCLRQPLLTRGTVAVDVSTDQLSLISKTLTVGCTIEVPESREFTRFQMSRLTHWLCSRQN
jgi:hypothetical protein